VRHWELLDEAAIPGSKDRLRLYRGKDDFFIKITSISGELMSSRKFGSEESLGSLRIRRIKHIFREFGKYAGQKSCSSRPHTGRFFDTSLVAAAGVSAPCSP
jgi:hypothetical protein